jgi:hypothetical protein
LLNYLLEIGENKGDVVKVGILPKLIPINKRVYCIYLLLLEALGLENVDKGFQILACGIGCIVLHQADESGYFGWEEVFLLFGQFDRLDQIPQIYALLTYN